MTTGVARRPRREGLTDGQVWTEALEHLGLCRVIALSFAGHSRGLDHDDIFQEGLLGLFRACELYDPSMGTFSTYAGYWIRESIRHAISWTADTIRTPIRPRRSAACIRAAEQVRTIGSLDVDDDDDGIVPLDQIADRPPRIDPDLYLSLLAAIHRLDPRSQDIVLSHHGLHGNPEALQVIASRLGCSRASIRRIEQAALGQLRKLVAAC